MSNRYPAPGSPGPNPGTYGSFDYTYRDLGRVPVSEVYWYGDSGVGNSPCLSTDFAGLGTGRELDITRNGGGTFSFKGVSLCNFTDEYGGVPKAAVVYFQGYNGGTKVYDSGAVDVAECVGATTVFTTYTPGTVWGNITELRIVSTTDVIFDPQWDNFEYFLSPAPTVTGISPANGPTAGGTTVTITGTGFVDGATVTIGGASATGVTFVNATTINATTPARTAGAKDVMVTNPDTQTGTLTSGFTYITNTAPTFVGAVTTLTVNRNAPATDIKGLLHVSDTDSDQTETWTQNVAPNHGGTLSFSSATATSGSTDITPGGTITYTPANGYSGSETFTVRVIDSAGAASYRIITVTIIPPPTVTDAMINISGASGTGGVYKINDTVTATWNNTGLGDSNTGVTSVTVDFSQFGGGAAVAATNSSDTWTATYTIAAGAIEAVNRNVSVTATNGAGSTTTADSTNATVDNVAPTIGSGTLAASNGYIDITFSEGIYGAAGGGTPLSAANLALTFTPNGSTATAAISSVKKNNSTSEGAADILTGGETTVRVFLAITGTPSGVETIEIKPANGSSVYDQAGNAMSATQTSGVKTLNDQLPPFLTVPAVSNLGANQGTLTLQADSTGTGYFTLLSGSGTACGTGAQVAAGQDSAGATAYRHGSLHLAANVPGSYTVRNLAQSTGYTVCFTADDGLTIQGTPATVNLTTTAAAGFTNPIWNSVGSTGISTAQADYTTIAFAPDGTPYLAFEDYNNSQKATVMKFNGTGWEVVGNAGFSDGVPWYMSLAFAPDGAPHVVYQDGAHSNYATVMKYSGGSWTAVGGAGSSPSGVGAPTMAFAPDGTPYVVYAGDGAEVMKYDSVGGWTLVGTVGSAGPGSTVMPSLAIVFAPNGAPYIAYVERPLFGDRYLNVKTYDGANWNNVGSPLVFMVNISDISLAITPDGTPYLAYSADFTGGAVLKYDSASGWTVVGETTFSGATASYASLATAPDGTPYVAYRDGENSNKSTVRKYDSGSGWIAEGGAGFSSGAASYTSLAFAPDGTPYVAYNDDSNSSRATVKKLVSSYTVTYNGNNSTGGTVPVDGGKYVQGATVTVSANTGFLTRSGHVFLEWNTAADGSGTAYSASGSATFTMGTANVTLYAQWRSAPTVTTNAATGISSTGATLNGTVNDNGADTTVTFDYGLSAPDYGTNVAATTGGTITAGTGSTSVAKTLTGLTCNTTYHFRANGVSSAGSTNGLDASFTTSACLSQTIGAISFTPATLIVSGTTTASATASSSLAVSFSSLTPSVCTVSGATVTGVAAGVCTIAADQAGDATYAAAPRVTKNITVANAANKVHLTHNSSTTDYTTIQAAADAAVDGDTISVDAGTFVEQVTITTAVTLQGAGSGTVIQAPLHASLVASAVPSLKGAAAPRYAVLDLETSTAGLGTVTVKDLTIDGNYEGFTQGGPKAGTSTTYFIGIAAFDSNATIDNVTIKHMAAAPLDAAGIPYNGWGIGFGIMAEGGDTLPDGAGNPTGGAAAPNVSVTINNCTIDSFQKTGIIAWGPKLSATITNNQISGAGIYGNSGQSGMQIGSSGARTGTTATISGNTIDHLGAPDNLVASGYFATGILPVTAGLIEAYNNTISLDPGSSANSLVGIDVGYTSDVATLHDNTLSGMSVGIQVDSPKPATIHQISTNTLTTVGGNPVVFFYDPAGNGDTGGETIANFATGYAIQVKGENFSSGTLTAGDGTGLGANSVQAAITGSATTLHIDSSAAIGSPASPLPVTLNGTYVLGNFVLSGEYIRFAKVGQTITFVNPGDQGFGTSPTLSATADSGLTVSFTSTTTGVCTITSGGALTFVTTGVCTINADQAGNSAYSAAPTVTRTFDVTLAPTITSGGATTFTYGTAGTFTVTTGGYPTPALTRSGILPLGVNFHDNGNGTATISGTPNASGSFTITITATNSAGHFDQSFTLTVDPAVGATSAVDPNIAITPERHLFGSETVDSCGTSTPVPFTVTNIGATPLTLETLTIGGTSSGEYQLSSHDCPVNPATFAAGASCTANVKFCPTSAAGATGSRTALLQVPSDALQTPVISAFLHNYESRREEAVRRMPPVLERLDIPVTMNANTDYTITWSLLGYEEDYLSRIVIFKCDDIADGSCGEIYNDPRRYEDSGNLAPIATSTGDWVYGSVTSTQFDYSHTFKTPATATNIVIRFYRKSQGDNAAGKGSLSLIVPGGVVPTGTSYYDKDGRRLLHTVE
jgi:hypothetical protein